MKFFLIIAMLLLGSIHTVYAGELLIDRIFDDGVMSNEEKLDYRRRVGSPFTRHLANFYHHMLKNPEVYPIGWEDDFLARKAVISTEGDVVMPERTSQWSVSDQEIRDGEIKLHKFLNTGGREFAPRTAAAAQAYFDCWVIAGETVEVCREGFLKAMTDVDRHIAHLNPDGQMRRDYARREKERLAELERQRQLAEAAKQEYQKPFVPLEDAMYLVFFDFDKSALDDTGRRVIGASADEIKSRDDISNIVVVGHTDTSGSDQYNRRLSYKRAESVRTALSDVGIDDGKVVIRGVGESKLLVQTENNVKEPANRRAEITFE